MDVPNNNTILSYRAHEAFEKLRHLVFASRSSQLSAYAAPYTSMYGWKHNRCPERVRSSMRVDAIGRARASVAAFASDDGCALRKEFVILPFSCPLLSQNFPYFLYCFPALVFGYSKHLSSFLPVPQVNCGKLACEPPSIRSHGRARMIPARRSFLATMRARARVSEPAERRTGTFSGKRMLACAPVKLPR